MVILDQPVVLPDLARFERAYALPRDLRLQPLQTYRLSVRVIHSAGPMRIAEFQFPTDPDGMPVALPHTAP